MQAEDQGVGLSACMVRIRPEAGGRRSIGRSWCKRVRQVEFPTTIEADALSAMLDREHAAAVTVASRDLLFFFPVESPRLDEVEQVDARWLDEPPVSFRIRATFP